MEGFQLIAETFLRQRKEHLCLVRLSTADMWECSCEKIYWIQSWVLTLMKWRIKPDLSALWRVCGTVDMWDGWQDILLSTAEEEQQSFMLHMCHTDEGITTTIPVYNVQCFKYTKTCGSSSDSEGNQQVIDNLYRVHLCLSLLEESMKWLRIRGN